MRITLTATPRFARGFTLIEIMVVVAILGILLAVAYPSYQDSIIRGNRKDAMATVLSIAQTLERQNLAANTYVGATIPTQSPIDGTAVYNISVAATATTYTITATPVGSGLNASDGTITLTETGARTRGSESTWD